MSSEGLAGLSVVLGIIAIGGAVISGVFVFMVGAALYGTAWLYFVGVGRLLRNRAIVKDEFWGKCIAFGSAGMFAGLVVLTTRLYVAVTS
ncbi:hypothetical protein GPX89_29410 [Nocardia sp. ET3-3]|uniref:Uncharacterized protein n=1 Tax=Nocardia terrae TaxID=2675851 RepID=A0A7K1V5I0_9NOCA|nr:hypothetical protein [Nocardia terrae]MVU81348.1 hypothetical protein [Nocardia terrae]